MATLLKSRALRRVLPAAQLGAFLGLRGIELVREVWTPETMPDWRFLFPSPPLETSINILLNGPALLIAAPAVLVLYALPGSHWTAQLATTAVSAWCVWFFWSRLGAYMDLIPERQRAKPDSLAAMSVFVACSLLALLSGVQLIAPHHGYWSPATLFAWSVFGALLAAWRLRRPKPKHEGMLTE